MRECLRGEATLPAFPGSVDFLAAAPYNSLGKHFADRPQEENTFAVGAFYALKTIDSWLHGTVWPASFHAIGSTVFSSPERSPNPGTATEEVRGSANPHSRVAGDHAGPPHIGKNTRLHRRGAGDAWGSLLQLEPNSHRTMNGYIRHWTANTAF